MAAAKAQIAPGIANIEGSVHDSSGAAIPNAHVELTETATNLHQETSTSTTGDYAFTHLNPGPYRIDVSAPGFEHLIRNATINQTVDETAAQAANVANAANIDLTLNPGSASETVTVAAEAAPLQSQTENQAEARNTPTVNTTISAQQIQPLPLEARNSIEFKKSKAAGSTATSAGARTATASHGVSAGFAARQGAFAKRADANQLAANALQQPLPNGQKPLATAATSNLLLAIDSTGALQLSSDAGKTWQPIPQQWTGRAVSLRVRSTPAAQNALDSLTDSPTGSLSDANPATPPATRQTPEPPPAQFEIITDEHATYVSTDGHIWKPK
jgi:Carboxypeptidase regulatory-like domain